ncbi:MAG: ribonuclease R [Arenicella sp.]
MTTNKNTTNKKQSKQTSKKHSRLRGDIVLTYLKQKHEAVATREIAQVLGQGGKRGIEETYKTLEYLREEGKITQVRRNRWAIQDQIKEVIGKIVGHTDGHGYVLPINGGEKIFLRNHDMHEVLHGDTVNVRVTGKDRRNKRLGHIIDIVERGSEEVVGRFFTERGLNFVVPNDQRISQDIFIPPDSLKELENLPDSGQVVICKITQFPTKNFQPVGQVIEILGDYLAPGMEIEIAKNEFSIPDEWPSNIDKETQKLPKDVNGDDFPNRNDIRHLPLVTIDGADARDFDDAVFCEQQGNGFRLVVAIADVSHYVKLKTALDSEAWLRGNSVYFPRQVIPMLPEVLSNGLCSLNPNVDRLCMVCDMEITQKGEIKHFEFYQAVMHSHARLTYEQVAGYLNTKRQTSDQELLPISLSKDKVVESLHELERLAKLLGAKRREKGSIDLNIAEPMIVFNDDRKIDKIIPRERNFAHRLIEECMLAANICAADALSDSSLAGIYRVHEQPDEEKIEETREFIRQFGAILPGGNEPSPLDYTKLLNKLPEGKTETKIINQALLRSFKQARYSQENDGHFALAFSSYTHFTSPIRRYSDLHVHRQLKKLINDASAKDNDEVFETVTAMAEQTSSTERRAEKATRAVTQWLKCEYMSHKVGEKLSGTIITVVDFGLFIELDDHYVEGLVHIANLGDDYFVFDETKRCLRGESSGQNYQAGQKITIIVSRVDLEQKRIDFDLANKSKSSSQKHAKKHSNKPQTRSKKHSRKKLSKKGKH